MSEARGRHSKNNAPRARRIAFAGSPKHTATKEALRKEWEAMSNYERGLWGFDFTNYKEARLHAAS